MTRAIEELTDRELDALVAERVMGCRLWDGCGPKSMPKYPFIYKNNTQSEVWWSPQRMGERFAPSTDISAAWEVAEKMKADGYAPLVAPIEGGNWRAVMLASLDENDNEEWVEEDATICYSRRTVRCEHANAARAIAICALRAKGVPHA